MAIVTEIKSKSTPVESKPKASKDPPPKFGAMPRFANQKLWSRCVLIIGVLIYMFMYGNKGGKETSLALQKDVHEYRSQAVDCDKTYLEDLNRFEGCAVQKCGRFTTDKLVFASDAQTLLGMAQRAMALGGGNGGATILDLHSGALSYGDKFINIYSVLPDKKHTEQTFSKADFAVYKMVKERIQSTIAQIYKLQKSSLYLTQPTFFSRLTNAEPKTPHDEYWHEHIDKDTYESFHYTALLYLSDYSVDFTGGRFVFLDPYKKTTHNVTIEPRMGRVAIFTSGAENKHRVERVLTGTRYALTIAFTCDRNKAIDEEDMFGIKEDSMDFVGEKDTTAEKEYLEKKIANGHDGDL